MARILVVDDEPLFLRLIANILGKNAMGVRIVNITKPDVVVGVARVVKEDQNGEASAET